MSFVKMSSEYIIDGTTDLENIYISEYMPTMPDIINKVYIYGLFLARQHDNADNCAESFAARLGLDSASLLDAYAYLAELGLVQVLRTVPVEVRYLPIKLAANAKKYKPAKYADFNTRIQEILSGRHITPNEYIQYYDFLETTHMEQDALLLIAKYATTVKDDKIGYSYILTVARNWFAEGVTTVEHVEQRLLESDRIATALSDVFKALGSRKAPDFEDRQRYLKWTKGMEYDAETITAVAKTCKKGGMSKLDAKLARYYSAKLFTLAEINEFEAQQDRLYAIARAVNKKIGLYYEQLDNVVNTYVTVWLNLGFDESALYFIADSCFRRGVRTLEGLNDKIESFYRQGLVSVAAIQGKLTELSSADSQILEILAASGTADKSVRSRDRDLYRTWTYAWGLPHELVLYAATLARTAAQPLPYINKILSDWNARGVKTVAAAKALGTAPTAPNNDQVIKTHDYTPEQLNALIDDIDGVEF